jgi:hypothetical protein
MKVIDSHIFQVLDHVNHKASAVASKFTISIMGPEVSVWFVSNCIMIFTHSIEMIQFQCDVRKLNLFTIQNITKNLASLYFIYKILNFLFNNNISYHESPMC